MASDAKALNIPILLGGLMYSAALGGTVVDKYGGGGAEAGRGEGDKGGRKRDKARKGNLVGSASLMEWKIGVSRVVVLPMWSQGE